jgi:hypothetical protein
MSEKDRPGEVVGRVSGLTVGSGNLERPSGQSKSGEAGKPKAVLFVHEEFDPDESLDQIEVVVVDAETMQKIVERRT